VDPWRANALPDVYRIVSERVAFGLLGPAKGSAAHRQKNNDRSRNAAYGHESPRE